MELSSGAAAWAAWGNVFSAFFLGVPSSFSQHNRPSQGKRGDSDHAWGMWTSVSWIVPKTIWIIPKASAHCRKECCLRLGKFSKQWSRGLLPCILKVLLKYSQGFATCWSYRAFPVKCHLNTMQKEGIAVFGPGIKVLPEDQASAISEYRYYASLKAFSIHIRCDNQILQHRINAAWMHRLSSSREWIFWAFMIIKLSIMDRFTKPFFFSIQFSTSLFYFCNMLHFWKRFGVFLYRSFWTILLFLRIIFYFRSFPCHGPIPN